ncbi:MAG: hypothetical protein ACYDFT_05570 [Thermoplasmata archaeon]
MAVKHHRGSGRCYLEEWHSYRQKGKVISKYVGSGPAPSGPPQGSRPGQQLAARRRAGRPLDLGLSFLRESLMDPPTSPGGIDSSSWTT